MNAINLWNWLETGFLTLVLFLVSFVGGLAAATWVLVRIPVTYFHEQHPQIPFWVERHPILRWIGLIFKNILGSALVLIGIVLSLPGIPGPGLLTILIGITLLDFPGKRWLERKIIGRPVIFRAVNRLRARYGKPPLDLGE